MVHMGSTEVIYARVPSTLKRAVDAYAEQSEKSLTAGVVDLLARGLSATSEERSIEKLELSLSRIRAEKSKVDAELEMARAHLATLESLAERASMPLGTCPNKQCGKPITGHDLLARGRCPHCGHQLSQIIAPDMGAGTVDNRELLMLVGALGAVLAVAYLAGKR
jgi:hypothetical protein